MGRPLQPNPMGGPPTVPQALNRYAGTPVGQPGVAEGAGSNPYATAFWHQVTGTILGLAIDQAPAAKVVGSQLLGPLEISYLPSTGFQGLISRVSLSGVGQQLTRLPLVGGKIAAYYASRYRQITVPVRLDQGGAFADELAQGGTVVLSRYASGRLVNQWEVPVVAQGSYGKLYLQRTLLKTASATGAISIGIQLYDDWSNPYLTGRQKAARAGISGIIGFSAALAGGGIGALVGSAYGSIVPGVGTVVGAVAGFGLGLWGELVAAPQFFEVTGNTPERHLVPLP